MLRMFWVVFIGGILSLSPRAPLYLYKIQPGSPYFSPNLAEPLAGCEWSGVAGQVFGQDGNAVPGLLVRIKGAYDGQPVSVVVLTGSATGLGTGGFSYKLGERAIDSKDQLSIQVFNLLGKALSPKVKLSTSSQCDQNLVMVNFATIRIIPSEITVNSRIYR